MGYISVADNMDLHSYRSPISPSNRLAVIASETREMSRNSNRIWPYSSSRSSKVIDLGINGKPICDFLLVINCNFSRICYLFRDIEA